MSRTRQSASRLPWEWLLVVSALLAAPSSVATAATPDARLIPLDGPGFTAALLRLEADGQIMLGVAGKPRTLAAGQWVRWGAPATLGSSTPLILTTDGSILPIDLQFEPVVLRGDQLKCDTRRLGRLELPLKSVRGIVYTPAAQLREADALVQDIWQSQGTTDQLLLSNGDRLAGQLMELGADTVKLDVDQNPLEVALRNVVAVIFNPALAPPVPAGQQQISVGLSDGSRIACQTAVSSGTTLSMTTRGGVQLSTALANVVWLQPLNNGLTYLSDLEPAGYRHTPYLSLNWPYHRDRNVLGGQLRSGGRTYLKGLGMHSTSLISYTLGAPYRRLDAELAIDDQTEGRGSVVFRVYVDDGNGQWQRRYESPIIRGGEPPVPISVDLKGAKRIALLADVADRGDEQDHANWLDARLVR